MTVSELIAELQRLPQHHTVMINIGCRYNESVQSVVTRGSIDIKVGPTVVIDTVNDPRNDSVERL